MASMDKEGGALFANNRKTNQSAPDYRGELRLNADTVANIRRSSPRLRLLGGRRHPTAEPSTSQWLARSRM